MNIGLSKGNLPHAQHAQHADTDDQPGLPGARLNKAYLRIYPQRRFIPIVMEKDPLRDHPAYETVKNLRQLWVSWTLILIVLIIYCFPCALFYMYR